MEDKRIKLRVRLVIVKEGKLLVDNYAEKGYYFYVGGKVEFGESIAEACEREIKEECGRDAVFDFKKILYLRDYINPEENEHSFEVFILGGINKEIRELEGKREEDHEEEIWLTWLDLDKLPDNLMPKNLTPKLLQDYKDGFPRAGEYVGRLQ